MNRQEIERKLREITFDSLVAQPGHKRQLRLALHAYGAKHRVGFWLWIKEQVTFMSKSIKPSSFVAGALVALLLTYGVQAANSSPRLAKYNPFATHTAQAKAQVKDIMFKAQRLNPEQRAAIEKKIQADMKQSLEEAYAANDLVVITGEEAQRMVFDEPQPGQPMVGRSVAFMGDPTNSDVKGTVAVKDGEVVAAPAHENIVKQLRYTDSQGRKVTLGIGEDDLPIFKLMTLSEQEMINIRQKMSTQVEGEEGGPSFQIGFPPLHSEVLE